MNKKEALHAMIDGKKVKPINWGDRSFLQWQNGNTVNSAGDAYDFNDVTQEHWEIYEEPKQIEKVEVVYFKTEIGVIKTVIKDSARHEALSENSCVTEVTI